MSRSDSELLDVRKRATVIQGSIERMQRVDLPTFRMAGSNLNVSIYTDAGRLRLVDEQVRAQNGSYSRNRYYYNDNALFFFYAKARIRVNPGETPPEYADGLTRMYFNNKGNMFDYEKTINGLPADLQDGELAGIMRRAFALRELEWNDSTGMVDTTAFLAVLYTVKGMTDLSSGVMAGSEDEQASADDGFSAETGGQDMTSEEAALQEMATAEEKTREPAEKNAAERPAESRTAKTDKAPARTPQTAQKQSTGTGRTSAQESAPQAHTEKESAPTTTASSTAAPPPPVKVPPDEVLIDPHTHAMLPGKLSSHRIRFQSGYTATMLSASVHKGSHKEYVLRARNGQKMSVELQTASPNVFFRIFLNDGDISGQRRSWSGTLPRSGDYHIVVYVNPDAKTRAEAPYSISMSIE